VSLRRSLRNWKTRLRILCDRLRFREPVIHLYCLCWNEERMLPFFFRHYDPLVDRYFVFDHGSTDRSIELLTRHPKVTVESFQTVGHSVINEAPAFYEAVWHRSRSEADWVLIVNIDELLHHPNGRRYFKRSIRDGITILGATGYEMVSERFPHQDEILSESITRGIRATYMDKLCAFRPDAVRTLNFEPGRHAARPKGHIVHPARPELNLLHYKYLGESYVVERYGELAARTPESDRRQGLGKHYFRGAESILEQHRALMMQAAPVPGLGGRS
jgi:Glycosyl transferase family 2